MDINNNSSLIDSLNLPQDPACRELLETMSIYKTSKEIYELTNVAMGRSFEYTISNTSSNVVNIISHEQLNAY